MQNFKESVIAILFAFWMIFVTFASGDHFYYRMKFNQLNDGVAQLVQNANASMQQFAARIHALEAVNAPVKK